MIDVLKTMCGTLFFAVSIGAYQGALGQEQSSTAPSCALKRLASLDITALPSGRITVPVGIAGKTYNFFVSLQGGSGVTAAVADNLKLKENEAFDGIRGPISSVLGLLAIYTATVPDLQIGRIHSASTDMSVLGLSITGRRSSFPEGDAVGGVLGINLLQNFGVELDFASNKLNLYEPSACGISTVFWAHDAATVPFVLDQINNVIFHMQLDGKDVSVIPELDSGSATMGTYDAETLFGLKDGSPGFEPIPTREGNLYRYPFKSLSVSGLAISNPSIIIYPDGANKQCQGKAYGIHVCWGGADVKLTLRQLRSLHMFFSFKEGMLYVTAAEAHL